MRADEVEIICTCPDIKCLDLHEGEFTARFCSKHIIFIDNLKIYICSVNKSQVSDHRILPVHPRFSWL